MKRLSKAQETARAALLDDLRESMIEIHSAVTEVNRVVGEKLNVAVTNYNEALAAVTEFKDEVFSEMDAYYDSRSDSWRQGENGSAYETWKGEWQNVDLSELDPAPEINAPDMTHADDVESLPSEPEG